MHPETLIDAHREAFVKERIWVRRYFYAIAIDTFSDGESPNKMSGVDS